MAASDSTGAKVRFALNRRELLKAASGMAASSALAGLGWAEGMPAVTHPRATSGDTAIEPDWQERVTVTVGPEKADLTGADEKVLQAAVDYVARLGGGTVHVLPGTMAWALTCKARRERERTRSTSCRTGTQARIAGQ